MTTEPASGRGGSPAAESPCRALVLSFSDLSTDARVGRQLALLVKDFDVTALGFKCPSDVRLTCHTVPGRHWSASGKILAGLRLKSGSFEAAYRSSRCVAAAQGLLRGSAYDLIVANDIWTLPLALEIRGKAKVLFDAHEYAPREFEESWTWRFFFRRFNEYLCRRYMSLADEATTVCGAIAEEYHGAFGVRMSVIDNAPPYQDLQPRDLEVAGEIRLVHHGGAVPSRRLEAMIEAMRHLDGRFTLDFVLLPTVPRYLDRLRSLASGDPRIRFVAPVPMRDLPSFLNRYDVGIYLLPPTNLNNLYALPNKFFDFIQARLAIAVGPAPEMEKLVTRHRLGVVSADFSPRSFAAAIGSLTHEKIATFKRRAHEAAAELCFEKNAEKLHAIIHRLLARRSPAQSTPQPAAGAAS